MRFAVTIDPTLRIVGGPMDFVTAIDRHREGSLADLGNHVAAMPKVRVGSLTLEQICAIPGDPHGIYFLYDNTGEPWYVGKASSRTFGTRLSANFDQREDAFMNSVPRKIVQQCQVADYPSALKLGLDLRLCLLCMPLSIQPQRLEDALRALLQPQLNASSKAVNPRERVAAFLAKL